MYVNKWLTFVVSAPIQLSSGLAYLFPLWSEVLKKTFNLSQPQAELIGSAINFGGYSGVLAGIFYDAVSHWHKLGPRLTIMVGVITNLTGYLGLWAAVQGYLSGSFWQLMFLAFIAANGGTWTDVAGVATNMRNFPTERGTVVGLMKAYVGLSASVYTSMYYAFFAPRTDQFLLCLAIVPSTVALLTVPFFNYVPFQQESESHRAGQRTGLSPQSRFLLGYYIVALLAVYQVASVFVRSTEWGLRHAVVLGVGTLAFVAPLLLTAWCSGGLFAQPEVDDNMPEVKVTSSHEQPAMLTRPTAPAPAVKTHEPLVPPAELAATDLTKPLLGPGPTGPTIGGPGGLARHQLQRLDSRGVVDVMPDVTPLECLVSLNFWLLFTICCAVMGSGLMLLNNLAQLVLALGGAKDSAGVLTSVYSIMNCAGRLLSGIVSEQALHKWGAPRSMFVMWTAALAAVAMLLAALGSLPSMFLLAAVMGIAFGSCWALMPALASELFGMEHLATNYCLLQMAPAVGGLLMATEMAGGVYTRAGREHGDPTNTCFGRDCYRSAFLGAAVLDVLAAGLGFWLYRRTRHIYRLEYSLLPHAAEEDAVEVAATL